MGKTAAQPLTTLGGHLDQTLVSSLLPAAFAVVEANERRVHMPSVRIVYRVPSRRRGGVVQGPQDSTPSPYI
jgi:hypothetical protein